MSAGKGGGATIGQTGNGSSTTDTSQYGMNNNQYNQSYPTTSVPQPVTSKYFGNPGQPGQAGTGMQFNQPVNQPTPGPVENMPGGGLSGKGGGSSPFIRDMRAITTPFQPFQGTLNDAGPAPFQDTGFAQMTKPGGHFDPVTGQIGPVQNPGGAQIGLSGAPGVIGSDPMSPQNLYQNYQSVIQGASDAYTPNFQNAQPQAANDQYNQQALQSQQQALFNPSPTLGGGALVSPGSIAQSQLSNPGVYSRAQRYSSVAS